MTNQKQHRVARRLKHRPEHRLEHRLTFRATHRLITALALASLALLTGCGVQNLYIDDDPVGFRDPFYVIERTLPLYEFPLDPAVPGPDLQYAPFTVVYTGEARDSVILVANLEQAVEGKWNTWTEGPSFALAEGGKVVEDDERKTVRGFGILPGQDPKQQYGREDPRRLPLDLRQNGDANRHYVRLLVPRENGLLNGRRYRLSLFVGDGSTAPSATAATSGSPAERVYYDFYVAESNTLVSLVLGAGALVGFTLLGTLAE